MVGGRLPTAVLIALLAGGCDESSPSGAELASEAAIDAPAPVPRAEVEAEPPPPEAERAAAERPAPRTYPRGEEYLTQLIVEVDEGVPRATVDRIAETVGATVTTAVEEYGVYSLRIDVGTAEERDEIIARIAAEPGVREARPARSGFRGRGSASPDPGP